MAAVITRLSSSAINSVSYDTETQEMTVTFARGKTYALPGVPPDVHERFVASSSPGRFFQDELKGQY